MQSAASGWVLRAYVEQADLLADARELEGLGSIRELRGELAQLAGAGERAWKAGDIAEAIAHVLAVRAREPRSARDDEVRQRALLTFATYARNLGKLRLARRLLEDLLCQSLGRDLLVDVLVLAASVWRGLGALEGGLALVERAAKRVDPADLARVARVRHQTAKLLLEARAPAAARSHLEQALALYRAARDPYNEVRAGLLRTEILEALRRPRAALASGREVLAAADRHGFGRLKVFGHLELGRLLLLRGDHEPALLELQRGLGSARLLADRGAQIHAHARLSAVYAALGERRAAALHRRRLAGLCGDRAELPDEVTALLRQVLSQ